MGLYDDYSGPISSDDHFSEKPCGWSLIKKDRLGTTIAACDNPSFADCKACATPICEEHATACVICGYYVCPDCYVMDDSGYAECIECLGENE